MILYYSIHRSINHNLKREINHRKHPTSKPVGEMQNILKEAEKLYIEYSKIMEHRK